MTSSTDPVRPGTAAATPAPPPLPQTGAGTAFVPLLLLALALVGWLGFQAFLLVGDHRALLEAHAAQQQTMDNAVRMRASLDALAADTQRLADAGNPNAGMLVAELRKRGITINASASASASASANAPDQAASR